MRSIKTSGLFRKVAGKVVRGDFASENILPALIVQGTEGLPFREVVIRIGSDGFWQDFLRMRKKAVKDVTCLDKFFLAI